MSLKSIFYYSLGPVGTAFLSFATLPLITWFYSLDSVANYSVFQVLVSAVVLGLCLGLDQGYVRDYYESKYKNSLFQFCLLISLLLFIIFTIVFVQFSEILNGYLFSGSMTSYLVPILLVSIFINILVRYLSLSLRMEGEALAFSISQLLPKVFFLLVILVYAFWGLDNSLQGLLLANLLSLLVVMFITIFFTRNFNLFLLEDYRFSTVSKERLIIYSLPLVFSSLAFWGMTAADKIYLKLMSNSYELAIYSVAVSFASVGVLLQAVFSTVWAPQVYKWVNEGKAQNKIEKVTNTLTLMVMLLWALVGMGSWLAEFLLPEKYNGVSSLIIPSLAYPLLYTLSECTSVGLNVRRKTKVILFISLVCLGVNILLNFIFIPLYGAKGAVLASVLAFWCYFSLKTYYSFKYYVRWDYFIFWILIALFSLLSILSMFLSQTAVVGIYSLLFAILLIKNMESVTWLLKCIKEGEF